MLIISFILWAAHHCNDYSLFGKYCESLDKWTLTLLSGESDGLTTWSIFSADRQLVTALPVVCYVHHYCLLWLSTASTVAFCSASLLALVANDRFLPVIFFCWHRSKNAAFVECCCNTSGSKLFSNNMLQKIVSRQPLIYCPNTIM